MLIDTLLEDFAKKRWGTQPFERLVALLTSDPLQAAHLAEATLARVPEGGTFLDLTLSFVPSRDFEQLIEKALLAVRTESQHGAAEAILSYASLQFPALLHPHLSTLFALQPNRGTYYENWPWREAGEGAQAPLLAVIDSDTGEDRRLKAWHCLFEVRLQQSFVSALTLASSVPHVHPVRAYLHEVGYDSPEVALYDAEPCHMVFDEGHFTAPRPAWMDRQLHPTWLVRGQHISCRVGGYSPGQCGLCEGPLHHLISLALPPVLSAPAVTVAFATCLSCLGWERRFLAYSHSSGSARPLETGQLSPQFRAVALKETTVRLTTTPPRWRWQDWALSNGRENLNRVGGHPTWVQSAEYPECPQCAAPMRFVFQLDSDLPTEDGDEWQWGSGGICYGFWCFRCQVSGFLWQCT